MSRTLQPKPLEIKMELWPLQKKAWDILQDRETNVLLFGGSAGCGKSYLACVYLVISSLQYPGTTYGLTRSRLIDLERSTLITLDKVLKEYHLEEGVHYTYDRSKYIITFYNGSKIICFDSAYYPTDRTYERLSSMELTGCVIDEASQVVKVAFETIQTRVRFQHERYNLIPKLLIVSNPCLTFIKSDIYEPFINGTLEPRVKAVLGLVDDNPSVDKSYKENLENMSGPIRSRLLYGDWNYASSDESIFNQEALVEMFWNSRFVNTSNKKYLTCDPAASGADKTCISIWSGLECIKVELLDHKTIPQIYERITYLMKEHLIPVSNVAVDRSGVGTGLSDMLKGSVQYVANNRPSNQIYGMLKDELYYMMADYINSYKIKMSISNLKDEICQEFGAHIMYKYDLDNTKTQILPKDKVKMTIGRSPDISDSLILRMMWEVQKPKVSISFV